MNNGENSNIKTEMSVNGFGLVKDEKSPNISNLVKPNVMKYNNKQ